MQAGRKPMSEQVTSNVSYGTAGATFFAGALSLSDWALIIGILATIATLALNAWVQRKRLKMEEREHQARMSLHKKAGAE